MLTDTAYGKSGIRLVQVRRRGDRHTLTDFTIAVRFEGDYGASYTDGDNRDVLPTDTMKNTVYALAAGDGLGAPEAFGLTLAGHFLEHNPTLRRVRIDLAANAWERLTVGGREHGSGFARRGPEVRTATVEAGRSGSIVRAGIKDLLVLKSSHSAFSGFPRDGFTTLPETRDRLLATSLTTTWRYRRDHADFDASFHVVRRALLECFAEHHSESVQHTLHAMGQAVLDAADEAESIHLTMPNKHHLPVDLTRFGLENRNEIFVATDEPFGLIEATVSREPPA